MPELPEIEVLRRSLAGRLDGRRIRTVEVRRADLREEIPAAVGALRGRTFGSARRRGKYLLLPVDDGRLLAIHLGMSGRLTLVAEEAPQEPHEHVVWHLEGGEKLRYVDPRRFGLVLLVPEDGRDRDPHFAHLGLEPLGEGWGGESLARRAVGRRAPVKSFLMDARVVVGVGNIYASEALFAAGIHPTRRVDRIASRRWYLLARAVRDVLTDAIAHGGTTLRDYVDAAGAPGGNASRLRVYGREGEPCSGCGRPIRRRVDGGRSTFYCPGCQR